MHRLLVILKPGQIIASDNLMNNQPGPTNMYRKTEELSPRIFQAPINVISVEMTLAWYSNDITNEYYYSLCTVFGN